MTILITAATGTIGAPLTRALAQSGHPVRAFVRDPGRARALLGAGVPLAVGDFADRASLDRALDGVDRVFLACGNVPDQVSHECAVVDAAARAGVRRVVKLSAPRVGPASPILLERRHPQIEQHLRASGHPSTVLHPRPFMSNVLAAADTLAQTGLLFAPAGSAAIGFVDPRDVAACAAVALTTETGAETYALSGPAATTHDEIAATIAEVVGRPVAYVGVGDADAFAAFVGAGFDEEIAASVVAFYATMRAGSMSALTDDVETLTGRAPRSFAAFARDHAAVFARSPQAVAT